MSTTLRSIKSVLLTCDEARRMAANYRQAPEIKNMTRKDEFI